MSLTRTSIFLIFFTASAVAMAQTWSDAYNSGLKAVHAGDFMTARASFQQAAAARPDDTDKPTRLPGPVTELRYWRNGAPYSASFGAAYSGFKAAMASASDTDRADLLRTVSAEFETLLAKNQHSQEAYYFLAQSYSNLRDVEKQQDLAARYKANSASIKFKIDPEILSPEDKSAIASLVGQPAANSNNGGTNVIPAANIGNINPTAPTAKIDTKYALLIGNSESKITGRGVTFASSDVVALREKLTEFGGYDDKNIDIVSNGTAEQIKAAAQALADRVSQDGTVFIFFSGVGANLDGKDFLCGVDSTSLTQSDTMLPLTSVYDMFVKKGAQIFAFFQVDRPVDKGRCFGQELPKYGQIAQTQATMVGGGVSSVVRGGQTIGLFTDAMCGVLGEFHTNRVPITAFGWRVFEWMRGSRTPGGPSGATSQNMTLPFILNMDPQNSGF